MSGSVTDVEMRPDYFFRGLKKVIGMLCKGSCTNHVDSHGGRGVHEMSTLLIKLI